MRPATAATTAPDPAERDVIRLFAVDLATAGRQRAAVEAALPSAEAVEFAAVEAAPGPPHAARRRRLVARACLRRILACCCGTDPRMLPLVSGAGGKPRLATSSPAGRLTFNASHSGDLLLLGVATDLEIGVDVEVIRPLADPLLIAERHFSAAEVGDLARLGEPQRTRAFYAAWTRKEAFLKATGAGLAGDLASFDVSLRPGEPARIRRFGGRWAAERADAWRLHAFEPVAGALAAVAVRSPSARCCWRGDPGIDGHAGH